MRKVLISGIFSCLIAICPIAYAEQNISDALNDLPTTNSPFSEKDHNLIIHNPQVTFLYIPNEVRNAVRSLQNTYKDLHDLVDVSVLLDENSQIAPRETIEPILNSLLAVLHEANLQTRNPNDESLKILEQYAHLVQTKELVISAEDLAALEAQQPTTRWGHNKTFRNLFVIDALTANSLSVIGRAAVAGDLSVAGEGNISGGLTVNDNLTVSGTISGNITSNLGTVTTLNATNILAANIEATASLTSDGVTTLKGASPGVLSTNVASVVSAKATTDHAVQVGNLNGNLTDVSSPGSTAISPQVLSTQIGSGTQQPQFAGLTSTTLNIAYNGTNNINIEASSVGQLVVHANSGPDVSPGAGNVLNVLGDLTNVQTTNTAGSTLTISLEPSITITDNITATNGNIAAPGGTITAGQGLVATTGGLTVTAGGITSSGTTTLSSLGAGVVNTNGSGVVSSTATTNHAVLIGNAASTVSSIANPGTNGQVLLGATNADPNFATLTSSNNSISFTPGVNTLDLTTGTAVATSFSADVAPTVAPVAGLLNIDGDANITTKGVAPNTINVTLNPTVSVTNVTASGAVQGGTVQGGTVTSTGAMTAGTGLTVTTGNATLTNGNIAVSSTSGAAAGNITADNNITAGAVLTGGTIASNGEITAQGDISAQDGGNIAAEGSVTAGDSFTVTTGTVTLPFTAGALVTTSAGITSAAGGVGTQLLFGQGSAAGAAAPIFGSLTSSGGTVGITWTPNTTTPNSLNLDISGNFAKTFNGNSGTATPVSGALNIVGDGTNITTTASGNTVTATLTTNPVITGTLTAAALTASTGNINATVGNVNAGASITATSNITATNGNITATNGNISANNGTVTGGTGLRATTGGVVVTAGGVTVTSGGIAVNAGNINNTGNLTSTGTTTLSGLTAGAVTSTSAGVLSQANSATTGDVLLSQGAGSPPAFGSITAGSSGTMTVTPSGSGITLDTVGAILSLPGTVPTPKTATVVSGLVTVGGGIVSGTGFTAALGGGNVVITFSPAFSVAPMVIATPVGTSSTAVAYVASAATTTSVSLGFAGTATQIYFMAMSIT